MKSEQTLKSYCKSKGISISKLARLADISANRMFCICEDRDANLNIDTINKIYQATSLAFGEGLAVEDYLNIYKREE